MPQAAEEVGSVRFVGVLDQCLGEIARRPWGEESFYASDPFGNGLCFVSRDSVFTG